MTEKLDDQKLLDDQELDNQNSEDEHFNVIKSDISQVEVQAIFEIGRANIPLYDFDKLVDGYTFILDSKVDNFVRVIINGKCVALGILVKVNENIGVRIEKVFV